MTSRLRTAEWPVPKDQINVAVQDPLVVLKGLVALRRLIGLYPEGHPMIVEKVTEVDRAVQEHLLTAPSLRIDIIHGDAHIDDVPFRQDSQLHSQIVSELTDLGIHSVHFQEGVTAEELRATADFLWRFDGEVGGEPVHAQLVRREVRHITLGRIVPLDTQWSSRQWPDAPTGPLDPAYEESLLRTQEAFDGVSSGKDLDPVTVRDLVQLLIRRVARSNAALGQILAVKQYENLTYCHSVNVAMLSLLIGRQVGLDEATISSLTEAALLHDIGKTRVPLEIVRKPGVLDKNERKQIEAHASYGAEILVGIAGLDPLTPTIALEHHRTMKGGGYPDLGEGVLPHPMSQIVSVADVYEAITAARSYKDPIPPDRACLILARIAGEQLNTSLVKTFINTITFFPVGSFVRTDRDETAVVVRTNSSDPMHPVVALLSDDFAGVKGEVDTSVRDSAGVYQRHIVETLRPPDTAVDLTKLLA